ncbi:MAG: metallophosphoesterase family protein [Chloroflexota bacterium]
MKWQYPQISRRTFLMSLMVYSGFTGSVGAVSKQVSSPSIVRGPYLQRCHTNGVVVMWYTDVPCSTRVRFGTQADALQESLVIHGQRRRHVARINGLPSNTKYYYSVGTAEADLMDGTSEHYFRTAPTASEPTSTRIWCLGDSGSPNDEVRQVRDRYYAMSSEIETDLCIMLGDNAYPNGTESEYQQAVFDIFDDCLRNTPLWPTYGNHDAGCADCVSGDQVGPFFDIFKTPTQGEAGGVPSNRRDYYSFDYGNIHFVCLNSHDGFESQMQAWLEQDLQVNHKTWLIAYFHHPPYSKGHHDSDVTPELVDMRTRILPILESHSVDLVLTGHNHCYERSYLINGHYGQSGTFSNAMLIDAGNGSPESDGAYTKKAFRRKGAVYVAMGCSSILKQGTLDHPAMATSSLHYGSLIVDIHDHELHSTFLDSQGVVQDSFSIIKDRATYLPILRSS